MTNPTYENEIHELLEELSVVQQELIEFLNQKRNHLAKGDVAGLDEGQGQATDLMARLESCQTRRQEMLAKAEAEGLPSDSLQSLAKVVDSNTDGKLDASIQDARHRARLLQHHSLSNWVIAQRSLIHLTQMIEILATGGKVKPTYGKEYVATDRGALVDRAV